MEHTPQHPTAISNRQTLSNFRTIMASTINVPSVCIPRVHSSMDGDGVAQVFNEVFGQDCVHHVDMVERQDRKTGYPFFIAYVHFDVIRDVAAFEQCGGSQFLDKINADKEVRLVYRDPWFWKVRRNTKTKHVRRGPRILSDEDTEEFMAHQKKVLESRKKFNEGKQPQEKEEEQELASDGVVYRGRWYPNIVAFSKP